MNYVLIPLFAFMQVFFAACCFTNTRPGDGAMEAWRWFMHDLEHAARKPWGFVSIQATVFTTFFALFY